MDALVTVEPDKQRITPRDEDGQNSWLEGPTQNVNEVWECLRHTNICKKIKASRLGECTANIAYYTKY